MVEMWKPIKGYENIYEVSNFGNVKNIKTNYLLKPIDSHGYKYVHLCDNFHKRTNKALHRLVAMAFLPNKYNLTEINHKDGNKSNNKLYNLEWCSHQQNITHSRKVLNQGYKRIRCIETNQIFSSINEAAQ